MFFHYCNHHSENKMSTHGDPAVEVLFISLGVTTEVMWSNDVKSWYGKKIFNIKFIT
jgi:hypothetical protein